MKKLLLLLQVIGAACGVSIATAQDPLNDQNSIVRFEIFTGGTSFGVIDLELFDQDKPETVRNFLLYVYSGAYSNLLLHRLDPGFVIQAGNARIPTPASAEEFMSYRQGPNYGAITNEFEVGPQLSNIYGTIAMARQSGQTNSASTDWFVNLGDNLFLDEQFGGFTVFGRVINTAGERSGTNLLNYFNSLSRDAGIKSVFTFSPLNFFNDLPVNYTSAGSPTTGTSTPAFRDLFVIRASVVQGASRDRIKPRLTVVQPRRRATVTNGVFTLAGRARDNMEVARVLLDSHLRGQPVFENSLAQGNDEWTATIPLQPGTNVVTVRTVDWFGNEARAERRVFFSFPTPITLETNGHGSIIGITNQQLLEIGRNYAVAARPAPGNFFLGWRGAAFSSYPKVMFPMSGGAKLTALFSTNFFAMNHGVYQGVMMPIGTNGGTRTTGFITLRLTARGRYSGRLQPFPVSYPIRGFFTLGQTSRITGTRNGQPLVLSLRLLTNGTHRIEGTYFDGPNASSVVLYRVGTPAAPYAGNFNFVIEDESNPGSATGSGIVTIGADGKITMTGTLPDGTAMAQSASLLSGGNWAFSARAYGARGGAAGMMTFSEDGSGFTGPLHWFSPEFPATTGEVRRVIGSR